MLLVYTSRTGNIRDIVNRLNLKDIIDISEDYSKIIDKDFILFTYTDRVGDIPHCVDKFLMLNSKYLKGVIGSGNRNFGRNFCGAVDKISKIYNVPILAKVELRGSIKDLKIIKEKVVFSEKYVKI